MTITYPLVQRFGKRLLIVLVAGVLIFSSIYLGVLVYVATQVYSDTRVPTDAIIVLGAKSYMGDQYNPCLVTRVKHALELDKQNLNKVMIFSGGNDLETGHNEAETMQKIAVDQGYRKMMMLEKHATSTYENLLYTKEIMEKEGLTSAIIVTEPFHSPRASLVATELRINHFVSPATDSPCWTRWKFLSKYFLREPLAMIVYKVQGKM